MAQARVAAGAAAALLLIGAVWHFQPAHKLSAKTFVSAALDIETLDACKAQYPSALKADGKPGVPLNQAPDSDKMTIYVEKDGPCVCKHRICTNGRVCQSEGATGQCYLPRCPPTGTDIPTAYTAGCFCADTSVFKSSDTSRGFVGSPPPTARCPVGAIGNPNNPVATEDCQCGDNPATDRSKPLAFCYKGQTCTKKDPAEGECDAVDGEWRPQYRQDYALAVPSISSNAFTDATKFAICKSTAFITRQCTLPAPPATQEATQASPTCSVMG